MELALSSEPQYYNTRNDISLSVSKISFINLTIITSRKFYIKKNNSKVDSIETGRIIIAHLLP